MTNAMSAWTAGLVLLCGAALPTDGRCDDVTPALAAVEDSYRNLRKLDERISGQIITRRGIRFRTEIRVLYVRDKGFEVLIETGIAATESFRYLEGRFEANMGERGTESIDRGVFMAKLMGASLGQGGGANWTIRYLLRPEVGMTSKSLAELGYGVVGTTTLGDEECWQLEQRSGENRTTLWIRKDSLLVAKMEQVLNGEVSTFEMKQRFE